MEGVEKIMKNFIKKLFEKDSFLKIISFILAAFFWVYIVFITNPEIEVKITDIPITLANHQSIKNEGYIVANEITATVDIKVKGSRKMLSNLDRDSIIAYVDLTDCTDKKTYQLPVSIKLPYEDLTLVSSSIIKLPVSVDNYVTKDFEIKKTYTGELKGPEYLLENNNYTSQSTVTVSGPEPIVNTIDSATITIDLKGASSDISGYAHVKLLNSNNAEVVSNTLDIKDSNVPYTCKVLKKKNVPVVATLANQSDDYILTVTNFPTVTIIGSSSDVDGIHSIPTEQITDEELETRTHVEKELKVPVNVKIEENVDIIQIMVTRK